MKPTHKIRYRKISLNSQGYTSSGQYFGTGKPLYLVQVVAEASYPETAPARAADAPYYHVTEAERSYFAGRDNWNEPYSEYVRAWDSQEAIVIARPAIGTSMHKIPLHTLVECKRAFLRFETNKPE